MSFMDNLGKDWEAEAAEEAGTEQQEPEAKTDQVESQPEEPKQEVQPEQAEEQQPQDEPEPKAKFDAESHRKMMDERRKRQEAEAELIELRRQMQKSQEKPQERVKVPDAYEQPDEFGDFVQSQMAEIQFQNRLETSGVRAEVKYGEEMVKEAVDWATRLNDPVLGQRMRQSASPVEFVVQEYQQSRTLERIGGKSFEDAAREFAEQQGWIVSQPGASAPQSKPSISTPKRGLAAQPGSGGINQTSESEDALYSGLFGPGGLGSRAKARG